MIGRTNAQCFGASGAVDGVTVADLPTCPKSISTASNSGKVVISLEYSDTDLVSGVDLVYKAGDYPTSPTDGDVVTTSGAAESVTVSGLTNGTKYFFRVYLFRTIGGVKYFQTDDTNAKVFATPSAVGIDGMTPAVVRDNYLVIAQSGTFTMSIPENLTVTAYLVGGGCQGLWGYYGGCGGYGGSTLSQSIDVGTHSCSATIGGASNGSLTSKTLYKTPTTTTLKVDTTTYTTPSTGLSGGASWGANGRDGLEVPGYGFIGSSGGAGGYENKKGGTGGTGAGSGGAGGTRKSEDGDNGGNASNYGCGGGGGGDKYVYPDDEDGIDGNSGDGGAGKQGCIIIAWE